MIEKIIYLNGASWRRAKRKFRCSTPVSTPATGFTMLPVHLLIGAFACANIRRGYSARSVTRRRDGAGNPRSTRTQQGDPGQSVIV